MREYIAREYESFRACTLYRTGSKSHPQKSINSVSYRYVPYQVRITLSIFLASAISRVIKGSTAHRLAFDTIRCVVIARDAQLGAGVVVGTRGQLVNSPSVGCPVLPSFCPPFFSRALMTPAGPYGTATVLLFRPVLSVDRDN
jgi:hypothetical protein